MVSDPLPEMSIFQSTLSVRRATQHCRLAGTHITISIHALRKESDTHKTAHSLALVWISIHALRKESDPLLRVW